MCVFAEETIAQWERFTETLEEVSACSNGITIDHQPPIPGKVWTGGPTQHQYYQVGFGNHLHFMHIHFMSMK